MSNQEPQTPNEGGRQADQNGGRPQINTPLAPPTAPVAEHKGRNAENKKSNWTEIFALIAAITGGIAAGAGIYQGWVARHTERISNRAYVTSTAFQLINYGRKDAAGHVQWTLRPMIENTGNTSTRSLRMKETVSGGVRPPWEFGSQVNKIKFEPYVLPPHSMILGSAFGFSVGLPSILFPAIAAGVISYKDIFDYSHLSEYCYEFEPFQPIDFDTYPAGQAIRISGIIFGDRCAKHNCEDEDCGEDWQQRAAE